MAGKAVRREAVDATPIWFMRQAGRSLPRYRDLRAEAGMFEILRSPEAAAEITTLPLEYFPVDACVPPFNHFWVFVSGLTSQGYTVTVTKMSDPAHPRVYTNGVGEIPTTDADTLAFTCP